MSNITPFCIQKLEDFYFTKENYQNYGWCTAQHFMQQSISAIRNPASSMPVSTFINELHYQ
jgi:hypothetical protein